MGKEQTVMAVVEDKTSFVLYSSYEEQLDMLTDEQAGKWIKGLYVYHRTGEKQCDDPMVAMLLSFTGHQMDIDARKYAESVERRREAGKKGGRPRKQIAVYDEDEKPNITEAQEKEYIKRLADSLDSAPEKMLLQAYCTLRHEKNIDLPALIPQVYLYYDPQTIKQRGWKLFEHQKMDFLMIFSMSDRIVIEIDGKQHYSIGDRASPELYANMVAAQREMTLCGYEVYRFGGHEFQGDKEEVIKKLQNFFVNLMKKHSVNIKY